MHFKWRSYHPSDDDMLESWLDEEARRYTCCKDGWRAYYDYWLSMPDTKTDKNFWVLIAESDSEPCALFVVSLAENGLFSVPECFVAPLYRGKGIGSEALTEILMHSEQLIGQPIRDAFAAILADNIASRRMFEKAGFRYAAAHKDGDIVYYHYAIPNPCFCGHDCSRCVTRLASLLHIDSLYDRSLSFYNFSMRCGISREDIYCAGGRSKYTFRLCQDCPFMRCCKEKNIETCEQCPAFPCAMLSEYRKKFVNQTNQI